MPIFLSLYSLVQFFYKINWITLLSFESWIKLRPFIKTYKKDPCTAIVVVLFFHGFWFKGHTTWKVFLLKMTAFIYTEPFLSEKKLSFWEVPYFIKSFYNSGTLPQNMNGSNSFCTSFCKGPRTEYITNQFLWMLDSINAYLG